eukprot:471301_1
MTEELKTETETQMSEQINLHMDTFKTNSTMKSGQVMMIRHHLGRTLAIIPDEHHKCHARGKSDQYAQWYVETEEINNEQWVQFCSAKTGKYLKISDDEENIDVLGDESTNKALMLFKYNEKAKTFESNKFRKHYLATNSKNWRIFMVQEKQIDADTLVTFDILSFKDRVDSKYWIYYQVLNGPYDAAQLIELYRSNVIKHKTIQIQLVSKPCINQWYTIHFKQHEENTNVEKNLPYLYKVFVLKVIDGHLHKYEVPNPPTKYYRETISSKAAYLLYLLMNVIFRLHQIIMIPLLIIYGLIMYVKYRTLTIKAYGLHVFVPLEWPIIYRTVNIYRLCLNMGLLMTPLCTVLVLIEQFEYEMHSLMIGYLAWGITSFLVLAGSDFMDAAFLWEGEKKRRSIISKYSLLMAGINVGCVDVHDMTAKQWSGKDTQLTQAVMVWSAVFEVIPSMIMIIPAVAIGFIANYVLVPKFLLKCSEKISNDLLCFDNKYGCCTVLSSWDLNWANYASQSIFISAAASNILAVLVIVKILTLAYVKGHPVLHSMASKTK